MYLTIKNLICRNSLSPLNFLQNKTFDENWEKLEESDHFNEKFQFTQKHKIEIHSSGDFSFAFTRVKIIVWVMIFGVSSKF